MIKEILKVTCKAATKSNPYLTAAEVVYTGYKLYKTYKKYSDGKDKKKYKRILGQLDV